MPIPVDKLTLLLPMLSSPVEQEVVAAARAVDRVLKKAGHDWFDLAKLISALADLRNQEQREEDYFRSVMADRAEVRRMARSVMGDMRIAYEERKWVQELLTKATRADNDWKMTPDERMRWRRIMSKMAGLGEDEIPEAPTEGVDTELVNELEHKFNKLIGAEKPADG